MLRADVRTGEEAEKSRDPFRLYTHEIKSTAPSPGLGCGGDTSFAQETQGKPGPDLTFPYNTAYFKLYRGQADPFVTEECLSEVYQKGGRRGKGWWVGGVVYFGKFAVNILFSMCEVWPGTITRLFPLKLSPLCAVRSSFQSEVSLNWELC